MRPEVVWFFLPFLEDVLLLLHRFLKGPSLNTNSVYIVENSVKDCLTSLVLMSGYGHRIAGFRGEISQHYLQDLCLTQDHSR